MKALIVYTSKYGFTEDCVKYIADKINCEVVITPIISKQNINIDEFDWIIIGSPVYMGTIKKSIKQFCQKNMMELMKKNIILFVSCTTPNQLEEYFENGFPKPIYENAKMKLNFGGEIRQDKLSFFERKITGMVSKVETKKQETLYKNMEELIRFLNS